jgi:anion transporter
VSPKDLESGGLGPGDAGKCGPHAVAVPGRLVQRNGRGRFDIAGASRAARTLTAVQWINGHAAAAAMIAGLGAMLYLLPLPDPANATAVKGGAMLLVFIGLWLIRATPDYLAAIMFFAIVPALGLGPTEVVFSGFRVSALWLILAGFIIGGTIESTGLGARVAGRLVGKWAGSYPALVTSVVFVAAMMSFVAPSSIARVFMLIPIVAAISGRLGFEPGSNGRSGLMLAASLGTLIPCYTVLPAAAPNLVMLGTAERLFGVHIGYSEYLSINFPVLGVLSIVGLSVLICYLLPATTPADSQEPESGEMSRREWSLLFILLATLALWLTDFLHGVSPAWVALAAAALCLAPGFGPGRDVPLAKSVNLGLWLFIAAIVGAGSVVNHTGFGALMGSWLVGFAEFSPGDHARNYYAIVLVGMTVTAVSTTLGAPAVLTPIAELLSTATGFPITAVLMLQVPTWMFFALPYQLPAIRPVLALGGIRLGQCTRVLAAFTVFGLLVALPLQFWWLKALGYID